MENIFQLFKKIIPGNVFSFLQPVYHFLMAFFAVLFYGFPSRSLTVIGVTGTKGKTTVAELVHEVLSETAKVASLSSIRFRISDKITPNDKKMTMPGRFFVQRFLHQARKAGCKYVVLEVTSEGIKQFRHRFINFDAAVVTSIAPEHIESHGSFEKYLRAKLDLFWRLKKDGLAIINRDDPQAERFTAATAAYKIFYGKDGITNNAEHRVLHTNFQGKVNFEIDGRLISSELMGEFNFYNILAAVAVGLSQHIALEKIAAAISRISGIPGRMEFIQREPYAVVVDYAHTPDSLRKVYQTLRNENSKSEIRNQKFICVLGAAGGGRDKWKRPEMGKIAAEFCDEIILTNEDPYDENPRQIIEDIERGIQGLYKIQDTKYKILVDRREAIREALKTAHAGNVVVIIGKGSEPWIIGPNGTKIPWNEKAIVSEELQNTRA